MDERLGDIFGGHNVMNENRQKIWDEYQGQKNGPMERMFLDYNRYNEASLIFDELRKRDVKMKGLRVLDYGCGVADYSLYFRRLGSVACIYDIDDAALEFVKHRFEKEGFNPPIIDGIMSNHDLIIFGEVLDHLPDPFGAVNEAIHGQVEYIFTSSYPFRSDDPNDAHWQHDHHADYAREQQPHIRKMLIRHYNREILTGEGSLWARKRLI
jgi:SAM-dependent methyltransferase